MKQYLRYSPANYKQPATVVMSFTRFCTRAHTVGIVELSSVMAITLVS